MSMKAYLFAVAAFALSVVAPSLVAADDAVRNYGTTQLESPVQPAGSAAPEFVAFGHHRRGCCGNTGAAYGATAPGLTPALYNAYSTYQPQAAYTSFYPGSGGGYTMPNPYGYYQNGQIWGSSGSTYLSPIPVWNSPSGVYGYRYNGWGSYGWGSQGIWSGTGPAGWGYQGGFYW
ncbi:MAG: hypothetical protein C0483_16290 [Pirellula sp.]|nr:hypothetical protein [Pirellula sp.]